jgi:rSAM/selenodomain-associated transferase 1
MAFGALSSSCGGCAWRIFSVLIQSICIAFTMAQSKSCHVMLFAKAPIVGEVKTRLIPAIGAEAAAMLHQQLVERALRCLVDANVGHVELCCGSDSTHPFFTACQHQFGVSLTQQREGNLGDRMRGAFDRALESSPAALIVGADCPALTIADVLTAAAQLERHDAALIPADDGGYVLIGVRQTHANMFDHIEWGTDCVLAAQRSRFLSIGWQWFEGATRWDVDRPEDLSRLSELVPPINFEWS